LQIEINSHQRRPQSHDAGTSTRAVTQDACG